jgi:hypothetical protein
MNFVAWFGDWSDRLVTENASFTPTLAASARCGSGLRRNSAAAQM